MEPIKKTCIQCGKEFLVIKQEQDFLHKLGLALPNKCPSCRQVERLKQRGERVLYRTSCQNCGKGIIITYNPKVETRKILCRKCYTEWFEKNPVIINE